MRSPDKKKMLAHLAGGCGGTGAQQMGETGTEAASQGVEEAAGGSQRGRR